MDNFEKPEFFDVVDENNVSLGLKKERAHVHKYGDWHNTVHIYVLNNKNELLVHLRAPFKDLNPNCWDTRFGGHVRSGEAIEDTAVKELKEELGVDAKIEDFIKGPIWKWDGGVNREFNNIFFYKWQGDNVWKFNDEEVVEVEWMSKDQILKSLRANPEKWATQEDMVLKIFDEWEKLNMAKTKYILIGGLPHRAGDGGKRFCEELVRGFNGPIKILDCFFARPEERWNELFEQDKEFFAKFLPNKKLEIRLADKEKFVNQVDWADAIYLRGGKVEDMLLKLLRKDISWINKLKGKTLAGTSAGADAIAKYYYNLDDLKIGEGLGLLPIKVIVHWCSDYNAPNIDWDKAYLELKNYKEDLQIITLAEGEFKIF